MSCSVAPASTDVEEIVRSSDFVVTGLREQEDARLSEEIQAKPMLLISESAPSFPSAPGDRSVVYSGKENLFPLIRKLLEK